MWTNQQACATDHVQGLYTYLVLVKAIDIDTYWSNNEASIDNFTYLIVTAIVIDRLCDIPIVRTIAYCAPIYQNLLVAEIGFDRRIHTPILKQQPIVPISLDLLVPAIGIDRHIPILIEGVNRYRCATPQPIDIPIGIFNRLF